MSDFDLTPRSDSLQQTLAQFQQRMAAGEDLNFLAFLAENPELAERLQSLLEEISTQHPLDSDQGGSGDAPTLPQAAQPGGDTPVRIGTKDESNEPGYPRPFGDYELLAEIARGGMGVVYKARQTKLNRTVAIKMILDGQFADERDLHRFRAEAEAVAALDHPGIVPIFEVGQQQGQHFFSMAYVEGKSLAERIAQGTLPPNEAAKTVRAVALAVEHAHEHYVVHRALKPANILIEHSAGRVGCAARDRLRSGTSNLAGKRVDALGASDRYAELHAAGAGRRQAWQCGTALRRLLAGRRALRRIDGPAAVSRRQFAGHIVSGVGERADSAQQFRSGHPTRSGDDRTQVPGEVARQALRIGRCAGCGA